MVINWEIDEPKMVAVFCILNVGYDKRTLSYSQQVIWDWIRPIFLIKGSPSNEGP